MTRVVFEPVGQTDPGRIVADVMRPAAATVEAHGHLAAAAYLMYHADQGALVVVDGADRPVAIITERDVLSAMAHGADPEQAHIADWMNRHPKTVGPDTTLTEAAHTMRDTPTRHLPVVFDGRLVGIVASSDIIDALVSVKGRA